MRLQSARNARWALLVIGLFFLVGGCGRKVTRVLVEPTQLRTLDSESPYLKAHLASGGVYVLSQWGVDSTSTAIRGTGSLFDANRREVSTGDFLLPTDSVVLFETNVESGSGAATGLTVMAGVTAAIAGMCAINPKACFGSCPTFYAQGRDGEMELQAEGFSASIAPGLEATDIDMLLHTRPIHRDYTVLVTNEALETHVIRRADILAAPRRDNGRVFVTSESLFREASAAARPIRCQALEGDCLSAVSEADGVERSSLADSTDLATKETIEIEFLDPPSGDLGLVLVSRQTLMTTFLIYQALAYMGSNTGRWLAALDVGEGTNRDRAGGVGRVLGSIEIQVADAQGEWVSTGEVGETGPIASDVRVVPLPGGGGSPLRVRLRLTQGMWRLDQVALVSLGKEILPTRVRPVAVTREGAPDPTALEALLDPGKTLVTLPGDALEIAYRLPENPEGYEFFLEARGYYLEWMRQEWMAEENPLLAAQMLMDPASAMRALAPAFKAQESTMEHLFWNSRYVKN